METRMNNRTISLTLLTVLLMISPLIRTGRTGQAAPSLSDITQLAWLSGDWQTAPGGRAQIEEHWIQPAGGTMMGVSRTVAGGKIVEFEFLRIEQRDNGIYYVAQPKGRCPATDFKLTSVNAQEAVFENPTHDFPKRIIYKKTADDSLTASIDGGEGTKQMTFAFRKMK